MQIKSFISCPLLSVSKNLILHLSACASVLISHILLICHDNYFCPSVFSLDGHFLTLNQIDYLHTVYLYSLEFKAVFSFFVVVIFCVFIWVCVLLTVIAMVVAWITVMEGNNSN